MARDVKLIGRRFTAFACSVSLPVMTWACGARIPAGTPVPSQPDRPADAPSTAVSPPGPPVSAPAAPAPGSEAGSAGCALIAEPGEAVTTLAVTERIDPSNAPRPSNESERLLFRQLYETL